jgi:hypothetical protein
MNKDLPIAHKGSTALNPISWLFGLVAFAIGVVNTFWGNDPGFGVFIILLSFAYFLPLNAILKNWLKPSLTRAGKIVLGIFIMWAALGVGELFDKIELMMSSF